MLLDWRSSAKDPKLQYRGHIPASGGLSVDLVDAFGAEIYSYDEKGLRISHGRAGRQVASTRTYLRLGVVPPHERRRILALVKETPTAVRAKVWLDGTWVEVVA